uniref:Uncharacterized protein n=1 Tax=Elaeophora elaphi TaxID=1147741 RepID=A0A0R3S6E5_9BILA
MDNFMKSGHFYSKNTPGKNTGLKRISWRQHSQPQMSTNFGDDFGTMREMLARKRSLPRPPITTSNAMILEVSQIYEKKSKELERQNKQPSHRLFYVT